MEDEDKERHILCYVHL